MQNDYNIEGQNLKATRKTSDAAVLLLLRRPRKGCLDVMRLRGGSKTDDSREEAQVRVIGLLEEGDSRVEKEVLLYLV